MVFLFRTMMILMFSFSNIYAATLQPADSGKEIEVKISTLLKKKLKVAAQLKVIDEKGDDLRVVSLFDADKKKKLPKVAVFIDTKVLSKDKSGKIRSQAISIFSTAEIKVKSGDRLKLLEWANTWNSNVLPIRIQVAKDGIIIATNLVTTASRPLDEDSVLASYLSVIQIWPTIISSLEKNRLL